VTREKLFELYEETVAKGLVTLKDKNEDYNGDYSVSSDPFANFKASKIIDIIPEKGILLRCIDKFKRIDSFIVRNIFKVKEESVDDTIQDIIVYMVILKAMLKDRKEEALLKVTRVDVPVQQE